MPTKQFPPHPERMAIKADIVYTKPAFLHRTGFKDGAFQKMKRNGLNVSQIHQRVFILGSDFHNYLRVQGKGGELSGKKSLRTERQAELESPQPKKTLRRRKN